MLARGHHQIEDIQHPGQRRGGHLPLPALEARQVLRANTGGGRGLDQLLPALLAGCADSLPDHPDTSQGVALTVPALSDNVGAVHETGEDLGMTSLRDRFRAQFHAARERAGLSQPALSRATSWDVGHISKFERGSRGASLEKLEEWLAVCHSHVVVVPDEPTGAACDRSPRRSAEVRLPRAMTEP